MGQYYDPMIVDSNNDVFVAHPKDFQYSSKLLEQARFGEDITNIIMTAIIGKPMRVFWVGDYAQEGDQGYDDLTKLIEENGTHEIFALIKETEPYCVLVKNKHLINHTKKEYFILEGYSHQSDISPLPILTAIGNGRGSGDYYGSHMEHVGRWAGDVISLDPVVPEGYTELGTVFGEDW